MTENIMNEPILFHPTENNIIEEYKRYPDTKRIAKVYCISEKEVKSILKQAGIKVMKRKNTSHNSLADIGMSERDFYNDPRN